MFRILLIAVGGGAGTLLRYLAQGLVQRFTGPAFPWGTLVVNVTGCLLIGLLGGLFFGPRPIHEDYRFALLVGLLGGYTTFSTFGWETLALGEDGQFLYADLNVILSVTIGLAAVWLGKQIVVVLYGA